MDSLLLTTKLKRPSVTSDLVSRPRLVARLNERPARGLTVLSAPAGYGKTTLLSEWCEHQALPVAWVSLDENDNSSFLFLRYLVAALKGQQPNSFVELGAMLAAPQEIPTPVFVTAFVNQIDEWGQRILLVLDDYHVIQDSTPREFFSILVQNLPPNLHLVLAARTDPVLPLARARAKGDLAELRSADLRFTPSEVQSFLQQTIDTELDPAVAALVDKRMEGWAAGLRLASLSIRGQEGPVHLNFMGGSRGRGMTEYLVDEVLLKQPAETQDFLLRTCLVDRFSRSLAGALLDGAVSEPGRVLLEIQRANLFLVTLDDEQEWFRYHQLFQELLRERLHRQLGAAQTAVLYRRASEWFRAQGLVDEAIQYALKGDDAPGAARLIELSAPSYLNREDWRTVERWLGQIPPEVLAQKPLLQMMRAWSWWMQWKLEPLAPFLKEMEGRLERGELHVDATIEPLLLAYLYALQAPLAFFDGDAEQCIQYAQRALALAPPDYRYLRGWALFFHATSLARLGKPKDAIALLNAALEQDGYQADQFTARLVLAKVDVYSWNNELPQAAEGLEFMLNLSLKGNLPESGGWARDGLGMLCYDADQLEPALAHYAQGVELRHTASIRAVHSIYAGLAVTYQAMGRTGQANRVAVWHALALETQLPTLPYVSAALEARLALMQNDIETAVRRAATLLPERTANFYLFFEVPELTKLRVMIAEGSPASLETAQAFQGALVKFCEEQHCKYLMTNLLALGALLHAAQGLENEALETLQKAVESARGTGRIRTFADLGEPMRVLLGKLASRAPDDEYLRQILAAFETDKPSQLDSPQAEVDSIPPRKQPLVNPLTNRELDVLALLRTRLSNKEIADQLVISPLTVTKHTQNIYSKLGVNDRRTAVETALALGILTA